MSQFTRPTYRTVFVFTVVAMLSSACAKTSVVTEEPAPQGLPRPDFIIIHDFSTSTADLKTDEGISPHLGIEVSTLERRAHEDALGRMVAKSLARHLVEDLQSDGIVAYRAAGAPAPTARTVTIQGQFVSVDEGDEAKRVLIGFGAGSSNVKTHIQLYQGKGESRRLIQRAVSSASSTFKPGLLVPAAGAVASGSAVPAAVGAATAIASQKLNDAIEAESRRTSAEIADKMQSYYKRQGWLQ